jgi:SET domain-containing protein
MVSRSDERPVPAVRVRTVRGKGRGLIAARRLREGELIDRASVVIIPGEQWKFLRRTVLSDYVFTWEGASPDDTAIALGRGSFCNHSYSPNAYTQQRRRERVIEFIALRDIEEGEEVTINYNGEPDATDPVNFDVR